MLNLKGKRMAIVESEQIDADCAWELYKQTELLQHALLQKYHLEFIRRKSKDDSLLEMEKQLPF
jgi:hypothetical protein